MAEAGTVLKCDLHLYSEKELDDNRIDSMLRSPKCPFVLFVGTKKLVKRKEFEQFISGKLMI